MRPLPMTMSSPETGPTIANVADPDPRLVYHLTPSTTEWTLQFDADLDADQAIDTLAMLFHDGPSGGLWRAHGRTAAQGPFGAALTETADDILFDYETWRATPPAQAARFHGLKELPAPVACRHVRITVYWPGAYGIQWRLGVLAIGRRFQPGGASGGFDWGAGRRVLDLSEVRILPGGGRGRWKRARVPEVRGSFGQLTDAELAEFWALQLAVGESDPVLIVETPDTRGALGLHDRIHYGTLAGLDFYERRQTDKSRVDIRLVHWL